MSHVDLMENLFTSAVVQPKSKFSPLQQNIRCLEVIKTTMKEQRPCTRDELAILADYQGWGQFASVFEPTHSEHTALRQLLSDVEYKTLRSTVNTGYFTPVWLVELIYRAVERLGFTDGAILDPATGHGRFITHRPASLQHNITHAVDMDVMTGHVCRALNPDVRVFLGQPFEHVTPPASGNYGLAITNVPFSKVLAQDSRYGSVSIHHYYLLRMLDEVHLNGLVAVVVSGWLMDGTDTKIRAALSGKANLIAACRLPGNVFSDAGAQVVTDVLIFQRAEFPEAAPAWIETVARDDGNGGQYHLNRLYHERPELVAGTVTAPKHFMAANDCQAPAGLLCEVVREILDAQTGTAIYQHSTFMAGPTPSLFTQPVNDDVGVFEYFVTDNDEVHQRVPDVSDDDGNTITASKKCEFKKDIHEMRVRDMLPVKAALKALLTAEASPSRSAELPQLRANLNAHYDRFTKKHGPFNKKTNRTAIKADPWSYRLQACELGFNEGISASKAAKLGIPALPATWKKAPIFSERVIKPRIVPQYSDYLADALSHSLNQYGRVDKAYIAKLMNRTEQDITVMLALGGLAYPIPKTDKVELAALYLSGNVVKKLKKAEKAATHDALYKINVLALSDVQPAKVKAADISAPISAPWLPLSYRQDFVCELLGEKVNTNLLYGDGSYEFAIKGHVSHQKLTTVWGTDAKPFPELFELVLNNKEIKVTVQHPTDKNRRVVDTESTIEANQKAEEIRERWEEWVMADASRRDEIEQIFNDKFNVYRPAQFDGSYLDMPGATVSLYKHQLNAVARATMSRVTLLDHEVGAGKSWTIAGIVMEHRRLYPDTRAMVVMPNHLVSQFACSFSQMYPGANVIALDTNNMNSEHRRETLSRLTVTDFDVCVLPESSFAMIPPPVESEKALIQEEIDEVEATITAMTDQKFSVRRLETKLQNLKSKLQELADRGKDDLIRFDELGINMLVTDEAHSWKNLYLVTNMTNVGGLGDLKGSKKAFDLYCKTHYIHSKGGKLVFATGTTLLNSLTETFTWLRYMVPDLLADMGMRHFDSFSSLFAQPDSEFELSPAGRGYVMRTRLRKFTNLTELMKIYHLFADVITEDDLKVYLPPLADGRPTIPPLKNGEITKVIIEPDTAQVAGFDSIVERYKTIDRKKNNALALINEGRSLGLDARTIYPDAPDHDNNRISHVADKVLGKYHEFAGDCAAQLVFIDRSVPLKHRAGMKKEWLELWEAAEAGDSKAEQKLAGMSKQDIETLTSNSFSLYDDLKRKLIARGIPEQEIAFIHDYRTNNKKDELRALVNAGRIRVLIGSTQLMGSGLNVNERLCALHHVDAPLRPGDMVQRDGRIKRQGNKLWLNNAQFYIEIFVYSTARTLDAWLWQILETKSTFIKLFRKGDYSVRHFDEDKEEIAFDELKALVSDNPLILDHVKASARLKKLAMLERKHREQKHRMEDDIRYYESQLTQLKARLSRLKADADMAQAQQFNGFLFENEFGEFNHKGQYGRTPTGNIENGTTALGVAISQSYVQVGDMKEVGTFHGLPVMIRPSRYQLTGLGVDVFVKGNALHHVEPLRPTFASLANALESVVCEDMANAGSTTEKLIQRREADISLLSVEVGKPFKHKAEIEDCRREIARLECELSMTKEAA